MSISNFPGFRVDYSSTVFGLLTNIPSLPSLQASGSFLNLHWTITEVTRELGAGGPKQSEFFCRAEACGVPQAEARRLLGEGVPQLVTSLWRTAREQGIKNPAELWGDVSEQRPPPPYLNASIERERQLWHDYDRAPLPDQLRLLAEAGMLYLSHAPHGGRAALQWLAGVKQALVGDVTARNRFWELVRKNTHGQEILALPEAIEPPCYLRFPSGTAQPPILLAPAASPHTVGYWAYLRIKGMKFIQDVVCSECVAAIRATFEAGRPVDTIQLAIDRTRDLYYIFQGYHRALAARALGADYIFTQLVMSRSTGSKLYTLQDVRSITHEEHRALIAAAEQERAPWPEEEDPTEGFFS